MTPKKIKLSHNLSISDRNAGGNITGLNKNTLGKHTLKKVRGFPGGSDSKESTCNVGDLGSVSGSGRFPGEGNDNLLQYSCLENSMDRGA